MGSIHIFIIFFFSFSSFLLVRLSFCHFLCCFFFTHSHTHTHTEREHIVKSSTFSVRFRRQEDTAPENGIQNEEGCMEPKGIMGGGAWRWGGGAILGVAPAPSSAFSSSRRLRQAAFGFRFLSLTRCSNCVMTSTAWWSTVNLGWDLSVLRWIWHMRPSSLNASFISFTRTLHIVTDDTVIIHSFIHSFIDSSR